MIYGIFKTAFDFKIHRVSLHATNLPIEFEGLKIAQISDIHTGTLVNREQLLKAVEMILSLNPDLILFTGDLVNNRTDEAYPYKDILNKLKAPMGVYSVLGNHDYGDYYQWNSEDEKKKNFNDMLSLHAELGWKLLMNEHILFNRGESTIALIGVENWGNALRFPRYGKLDVATKGTEKSSYNILMSHDPSHWDAQVNRYYKNIDLTLSGHTHGFQFGVEIPGFKWSPSQYVYKQWAGVYRNGEQVINVNRGLGCIGYMGRVGIKPEISLITLSAKSDGIS
jgi:predicted MPP superfamily phosphohydrolase